MHHNERNSSNNFRVNFAANILAHINNAINSNDSSEASQRRQTFHMRSFASSAPYIDDDDVGLFLKFLQDSFKNKNFNYLG